MAKKKPIIYTPEQLHKRRLNLQSQLIFGNFLDTNIIVKLIDLFTININNASSNTTTSKIITYIEDERKLQGLNSTNVTIKSELYGTNDNNTALFLKILKNNIEFIHLTIHLVPTTINDDKDGIIHIYKDIYRPKGIINKTKSVSSRETNKLYALLSVKQPDGKPHSLEFSIDNKYYKTDVPNIRNSNILDLEIGKEMNVIVNVLNKLFDEDDTKFYIGNKDKTYEIHAIANNVLNNINTHSTLITRKK